MLMWVQKTIPICVCKENYPFNPCSCASECDKDCEIDKYLKNCTCVKNLAFANTLINSLDKKIDI